MSGYLKAIFDWFVNIGGTFLEGLYDVVRRFKWFFVAVLAALLAPIKWVLEVARDITQGLVSTTQSVIDMVAQLGIDNAGGMWSALAGGAALMNCVVPLDYVLSTFGVLLSLWLVIFGIKAAVWLYRLIPGKFT